MKSSAALAETFFYVLDDKIRILFVDDDPILREFAVAHLTSDKAEVVTAGDGDEAWRLLHEGSFDLVLLDLEMPRVDGFEFLQSLRAMPKFQRLPVIVVTGREDVGAVDRAFFDGATSFVVKPINWRLLSYQVRYVRQSQQTETSLIEARSHSRAQALAASEALRRLALHSVDFVARAVKADPSLRPAAENFLALLDQACPSAKAELEPLEPQTLG